jgi:hypothetical protein
MGIVFQIKQRGIGAGREPLHVSGQRWLALLPYKSPRLRIAVGSGRRFCGQFGLCTNVPVGANTP